MKFMDKIKAKSTMFHTSLLALATSMMMTSVNATDASQVSDVLHEGEGYNGVSDVLANEGVKQLVKVVAPIVRFIIYGFEIVAVVYFAVKGGMDVVMYFRHTENPQEAQKAKERAIKSFMGAGAGLLVSIIINIVLSLFK